MFFLFLGLALATALMLLDISRRLRNMMQPVPVSAR